MKIMKNRTMKDEYWTQFEDIQDYIFSDNGYFTLVSDAIIKFKYSTIVNESDRNKRYNYDMFKNICEKIKNPGKKIIGNLNIFTDFCIRLIKYDWMTKDEVIDMLKPWPYTDTLVEIIKYDKPLCVNRWEI